MATRIVDLDLTGPLPEAVPLAGRSRLWLVLWRSGVPVGMRLVRPRPGADAVTAPELARVLADIVLDDGAMPGPVGAARHPSISVVICTRNRPESLPGTFEALRMQTHSEFELVVVDNGSSDDRTRRVVEDRWPKARYIAEPVAGIGRARNAGLRAASGTVLAYTDDDCRPAPRWVETIARSFASDPALGCVTGPILPLELETPAQEAMEARGGFNRGFTRARSAIDAATDPGVPLQAWQFGAGGSMAFSRTCLVRTGGFDEALPRSEDLDAFYRTLRAGYAVAFEPGAAVHHRHLQAWPQLRRRLFHWGWGFLTFLDKVGRTDEPRYRRRARTMQRQWFGYQIRHRVLPAARGRGDLPLPLVLAEVAGGLAGYRGYGLARTAAARRADRVRRRSVPTRSPNT